jgi:hypothetical protein
MKAVLTFQEMKAKYPGEWLLIGDPELDASLHAKSGKVLAHSRSRDEVYGELTRVRGKRVSVEYAGEIPADLAVAL